MLHKILNDDPWFEQKRFGYGAGWPIAWQGWLLLGAYFAAVVGAALAWSAQPGQPLLVIVPSTFLLIAISRRHTRGGWRWRGGRRDRS